LITRERARRRPASGLVAAEIDEHVNQYHGKADEHGEHKQGANVPGWQSGAAGAAPEA
jgi:hypothetical protein